MREIPYKQWIAEEAKRCGVAVTAIYNRISRGKYPELKLRRVNPRVIFVQIDDNGNGAHPLPTPEQWRAIQEAAGPGGVHADAIPWLIRRDLEAYSNLRGCATRHGLGLGGEPVDRLVIQELDRLKASSGKL